MLSEMKGGQKIQLEGGGSTLIVREIILMFSRMKIVWVIVILQLSNGKVLLFEIKWKVGLVVKVVCLSMN